LPVGVVVGFDEYFSFYGCLSQSKLEPKGGGKEFANDVAQASTYGITKRNPGRIAVSPSEVDK
jgi:hypothetical protein